MSELLLIDFEKILQYAMCMKRILSKIVPSFWAEFRNEAERMLFQMGFFKKLFGKPVDSIYAPLAGKAVPITQVPDPTFAEGMLGNGIAIEPSEGKVYAPCDATVDMMFTTGHAVSLVADFGAEILIHVGLETVGLEGKPFTIHVANGDKVKKGQLLMEVDLDAIKEAGLNTITPMLICNTDDYATFDTFVGKDVTNDDVVIGLAK
jgi:PTS system beta-glucosides-specific IIC component